MRSSEACRRRNSYPHPGDPARADDHRLFISSELVSIAQTFEKKEKSWFVTSQIPSDLMVQIDDITFYIHKYPLFSRCGYFCRLHPETSDKTCYNPDLKIDNFPGGPDTFESVLEFCYGLPIDLTPDNVASLRCASDFLEMTEELEDGNLLSKTEAFLTFAVLSSWRGSLTVLKSCETLSPWAENLQIVRRCCDFIAWKVSRDSALQLQGEAAAAAYNDRWWFDDVSVLRIEHFMRVMTMVKVKGLPPETIGACIMHYADKWLLGFSNGDCDRSRVGYESGRHQQLQLSVLSGRRQEMEGCNGTTNSNSNNSSCSSNKDYRTMVESLVSMLPPQRDAVSCTFLLRLLKIAIIYSATPALVSELEKRVGMVLEDASVADLMIPNTSTSSSLGEECSSMYDVDVIGRIVEYFLMYEQREQQVKCGKAAVGKLLDGYLAEIAPDTNLSIAKFQHLADMLPPDARTSDDGLYRAIDTYLKTHPSLTEHERRRLCRVMDCDKLSLDASTHAAQNERLPVRVVMQVLFTEQLKMRAAIVKGKDPSIDGFSEHGTPGPSNEHEILGIKAELEKIRTMLLELQQDYTELQLEFDRQGKQKAGHGWGSTWKKKIKISSIFLRPNPKIDDDERRTHASAGKMRRASVS